LRVTRGPLGGTSLEWPILGGLVASYGAAALVTAEDGRGAVHRRIRALDPDGRRQAQREHPLYIVPLPDAGGPFPIVAEERGKVAATPQFEALREQLRAIPDLALVVLDPLQTFVHADINADPMAAALTMSLLNMLAAETGAKVLTTHHVRKEREAPKSAQEARLLIRGSSALVDQSRFAIVLWTPDEPEVRKVCKALDADFAPNAVVHGCVVKSNDGASREKWTLLRSTNGSLRDVTHALRVRRAPSAELLATLVQAIAEAAKGGARSPRPASMGCSNGGPSWASRSPTWRSIRSRSWPTIFSRPGRSLRRTQAAPPSSGWMCPMVRSRAARAPLPPGQTPRVAPERAARMPARTVIRSHVPGSHRERSNGRERGNPRRC
jgi:hypothetical protein